MIGFTGKTLNYSSLQSQTPYYYKIKILAKERFVNILKGSRNKRGTGAECVRG